MTLQAQQPDDDIAEDGSQHGTEELDSSFDGSDDSPSDDHSSSSAEEESGAEENESDDADSSDAESADAIMSSGEEE